MEENKKNTKLLIVPIVTVAAFLLLMFGAGYAYFSSSVQMNEANYSINLPSQTALMCTKDESSCGVTIAPNQMIEGNADNNIPIST